MKMIKRAGLLSSTLIVIGSIIGIGIFIKNGSIFSLNNGNSIAILVAWIIGAVIAILKGYSFLEISSISDKKSQDTGMVLWMDKLVGKHSRRITQMFLIVLYLGFICPIIVGYSINFFTMFLNVPLNKTYLYTAMFTVPLIFALLQIISSKLPQRLNILITGLKILPLLLVAFIGMFMIKNGGGIGNTMLITHTPQSANFTVGILISLPSILFSFDAFLNVASINKSGDKNTPVAIVIGMILVAVLYLLITISQININRGFVSSTFDTEYDKFGHKSFVSKESVTGNKAFEGFIDNTISPAFSRAFIFIVALSGFGVINIIMMAGSTMVESVMKESKFSRIKAIVIFTTIVYAIAGFLIAFEEYEITHRSSVVSIGYMNGDVFDAMSNIPVILAFGFYSTILIAGIVNRKTNKVPVVKKKGFIIAASIASIMSIVVILTFIIYSIIIQSSIDYQSNKILIDSTLAYIIITTICFSIAYMVSWKENKAKA